MEGWHGRGVGAGVNLLAGAGCGGGTLLVLRVNAGGCNAVTAEVAEYCHRRRQLPPSKARISAPAVRLGDSISDLKVRGRRLRPTGSQFLPLRSGEDVVPREAVVTLCHLVPGLVARLPVMPPSRSRRALSCLAERCRCGVERGVAFWQAKLAGHLAAWKPRRLSPLLL